MNDNDLEALVALSAIPHIGSVKIKLLLQHFGSPVNALKAGPSEISELPGFGPKFLLHWKEWSSRQTWQKDLEQAARLNVKILPFSHPDYPKRLLEIPDHPVLLYMMGTLHPSDKQGIAVIGTRHPSIYGQEMAEKFGHDLAAEGITVVSGLARGIDTAAHKGALRRGRTIAVIGSGLADIYPRENAALAKAIAAQGALISEFPMTTPPDRQNFPQRNRIVSGMTMGTVLIEAPQKSGAMITMEKGLSQGRNLFALPGRVDSENFQGNHLLIKTGQAQLVENAGDILNGYQNLFGQKTSPILQPRILLETEEEEFLRLLPCEEFSGETLEHLTKLPVRKINILLMSLILKRAIKEFPGRLYKKMML